MTIEIFKLINDLAFSRNDTGADEVSWSQKQVNGAERTKIENPNSRNGDMQIEQLSQSLRVWPSKCPMRENCLQSNVVVKLVKRHVVHLKESLSILKMLGFSLNSIKLNYLN
jgi:hypothetical protein